MQKSRSLEEIRREMKHLLVESLALENVVPDEIGDAEILFGEGLGLDSLDAVEIVVLVQRNYGLEIVDEEEAREIFQSLDTLVHWIHDGLQAS
ncbi:MAG: acyl carrier protein [Deltaproteobacteria bacterium]|nr:acyl carrier protein [Deltaproteobacteria bacterium]